MKVALFGECSGVTRRAMQARGHECYSFDFKPAEDGETKNHIIGNFYPYMDDTNFDLAIFHPTCKYNANSGSKHLYKGMKKENGICPERWQRMIEAADFVRRCLESPIYRTCIEHPVVHGHARKIIGQTHNQIIQPWQFGHKEMKATCLYLKNIPPLVATDIVGPPPTDPIERRAWAKCHREPPGPDREANRSRTLQGYANAYAEQWAG